MSLQQKEKFPTAYVDQELAITPLSQRRGNLVNVAYFNSGASQFPSPGTGVAPVLIPRIFPGFPDAQLSQMQSLQELVLTFRKHGGFNSKRTHPGKLVRQSSAPRHHRRPIHRLREFQPRISRDV